MIIIAISCIVNWSKICNFFNDVQNLSVRCQYMVFIDVDILSQILNFSKSKMIQIIIKTSPPPLFALSGSISWVTLRHLGRRLLGRYLSLGDTKVDSVYICR